MLIQKGILNNGGGGNPNILSLPRFSLIKEELV